MNSKLSRRRLAVAVTIALATLGAGGAAPAAGPPLLCAADEAAATSFSVEVDGEEATGMVALPGASPAAGIVAFAHGYGHTSRSWAEHLTHAAHDLGVIAVAMDYRGTEFDPDEEIPVSRGWQVAEGAADSIAATQLYEQACATDGPIVIFGVSMGGNTSGLAAAAGATRADSSPLYDWWVNVEGATNVTETYHEASALAPFNTFAANAAADIERQMGGEFAEVPGAYLERTVVLRAADIAAAGIRGVVMVHGLDDGLVPYNQSREMAVALDDVGLPYEMYTVARRGDGEAGTTITGTVVGPIVDGYESPIAGHASERSTTHAVMVTALERLAGLIAGDGVECTAELLVDNGEVTGLTSAC